jgi:hypothetical protein
MALSRFEVASIAPIPSVRGLWHVDRLLNGVEVLLVPASQHNCILHDNLETHLSRRHMQLSTLRPRIDD